MEFRWDGRITYKTKHEFASFETRLSLHPNELGHESRLSSVETREHFVVTSIRQFDYSSYAFQVTTYYGKIVCENTERAKIHNIFCQVPWNFAEMAERHCSIEENRRFASFETRLSVHPKEPHLTSIVVCGDERVKLCVRKEEDENSC